MSSRSQSTVYKPPDCGNRWHEYRSPIHASRSHRVPLHGVGVCVRDPGRFRELVARTQRLDEFDRRRGRATGGRGSRTGVHAPAVRVLSRLEGVADDGGVAGATRCLHRPVPHGLGFATPPAARRWTRRARRTVETLRDADARHVQQDADVGRDAGLPEVDAAGAVTDQQIRLGVGASSAASIGSPSRNARRPGCRGSRVA